MTMTAGKWQRNARGAASIWALLARSSIYKLLALAAVMALGEAALFYISMRGGRGYELTDVINSSKISTTFLAGPMAFCLGGDGEKHRGEKRQHHK